MYKNSLELTQSQKLVMNMQLKQSLNILNMSRAEIEEEIKTEEEKNPLLEVDKKDDGVDWESYIKHMEKSAKVKDRNEAAYDSENDNNFENMVKYSETMYEILKDEIMCFDITYEEKKICRYIIDSLDDDGYLRIKDKEMASELGVSIKDYIKCLKMVQQLEPAGIGARNLSECLLIQLSDEDKKDSILESIIMDDLELIGKNKLKDISKKHGINIEKCKKYIEIIRQLDPKPGKVCSTEKSVYVQPDVIIEIENGEVIVRENRSDSYSLRINSFYSGIMKNSQSDDETKEFIKERLNSAVSLMKNIDGRRKTILSIAEVIARKQTEFMKKGERYVKPMKMKDIAEELEYHESTISRGVNGKYMLTPFGLYEFKFFFSTAIETEGSESASSTGIKKMICEIIKDENKKKPLSDDAISKLLKEQGISVARRTVAKYREEAGIPSSSRRKEY